MRLQAAARKRNGYNHCDKVNRCAQINLNGVKFSMHRRDTDDAAAADADR